MAVMCCWCKKETNPVVKKERSDHDSIIIRKCEFCDNILASYLDEDEIVLKKVRSFQQC